ncbi:MAG: HAD-IA family hydrolase [Oscillospiraceae bacterium]|nr:HAD-IA family hydrolase [Oscillospiraceae bacterium]
MFDAFIFDFDLTLADTGEGIVMCCNHALVKMGYPPALPGDVLACVGKTVEETYAILTGDDEHGAAINFHEHWREKADEVGNKGTRLFPDTIESLKRLKAAGKKTAIVSNKTTHRIESVLREFGAAEWVDLVLGIEAYAAPKPAPDGVWLALKKLGVPRGRALYIGDSFVDMQTAAAAGVAFAGVTTGTTASATFRATGIDSVFPSLAAIVDALG